MKSNINDERNIKHLKESNELLKKENTKLKLENKSISSLKETILKLQEEKLEMSRKIIEMESEIFLLKDGEDVNDEMLYNPRRGSRISTISQKELLQKLQPNSSKKNLFNKEIKKFNNNKITNNTYFSILSDKNNALKEGLKNKNEEISLLKSELIKKEQIILELKKNKENIINNCDSKLSLNSSINNVNPIKSNENVICNTKIRNKPKDYLGLLSRKYSLQINADKKEINDSIYDENEAHLLLEKNIYSEIQNILEEKRNFILKTLTCENFSFDIINNNNYKNKKSSGDTLGDELSGANIEQILCLIRQRKRKVEMTKKYLEEKLV